MKLKKWLILGVILGLILVSGVGIWYKIYPSNLEEKFESGSAFIKTKFFGGVPNEGQIIDGDRAYWKKEGIGEINCPYTVSGFNAEIDCNFTSYLPTQNLDGCFAFPEKLIKTKAESWLNFNHPYSVNDYGNVMHNYTCTTGNFSYTLDPKYAWCYSEANGSVIFEHSFEGGDIDNAFIWWNEWGIVGSHQEDNYYEDWKDVTNRLNYVYHETELGNYWYCIQDINFEQGESRLLKGLVTRKAGFNLPALKYSICIKRSGDTLVEALEGNNYVCVDPWWNNSFAYKRDITNRGDMPGAFVINGSVGFTNGSTTAYIWVNPKYGNLSLYYNNATDISVINESGATVPYYIENYDIGYDSDNLYDDSLVAVWHYGTSRLLTNDTSAHGFLGANSGTAPTMKADCQFGNCIHFGGNGITKYTDYELREIQNLSQFTISFWHNRSTAADNFASILNWGDNVDNTNYRRFLSTVDCSSSSLLGYRIGEDNYCSTHTAFDNTWNHVLVTGNSGTFTIYIDGKNDTVISETVLSLPDWFNLNALKRKTGTIEYGVGTVEELRFYNRTLNDTEIENLFNMSSEYTLLGIEESIPSNLNPYTPLPLFNVTTAYANTWINETDTYTDPDGDIGTVYKNLTVNDVYVSEAIYTNVANGTETSWLLDYNNWSSGDNVSVIVTYADTSDATSVNLTSIIISSAALTPDIQFNVTSANNLTNLNCSVASYIYSLSGSNMDVMFNLTVDDVHKAEYILLNQLNSSQPSWQIDHHNYSANQNVSCWIQLAIDDDYSSTNLTNITISASSPNFDYVGNFSKNEDFAAFTLDLSDNISSIDATDAQMNFTSVLNDSSVFTLSIVNTTNVVTFTPLGNAHGSVEVNLTVYDTNSLTNSTVFTLTVDPVNDMPNSTDPVFNVSQDSVFTYTNLNCSTATYINDVDGDSLTVFFNLTVNDAYSGEYIMTAQPNGSQPSWEIDSGNWSNAGDTVRCNISLFDGTYYSVTNSTNRTITNTAPNTPDVHYNVTTAYNLTNLNCSTVTSIADRDGDNMNVMFNLTVDDVHKAEYILTGQLNGSQPSWQIDHNNYSLGLNVSCWITLDDSTNYSAINLTDITISSSPPTTPELRYPPDGYNLYNLTINLSCANSTDDDGDTIYYEFWRNYTDLSPINSENASGYTYVTWTPEYLNDSNTATLGFQTNGGWFNSSIEGFKSTSDLACMYGKIESGGQHHFMIYDYTNDEWDIHTINPFGAAAGWKCITVNNTDYNTTGAKIKVRLNDTADMIGGISYVYEVKLVRDETLLQNSTKDSYYWDLTEELNQTIRWTCKAHDNASSSSFAVQRDLYLNTTRLSSVSENHTTPIMSGSYQTFKFNVSYAPATVSGLNYTFYYNGSEKSGINNRTSTGEEELNISIYTPLFAYSTNQTLEWNLKYVDINGSLMNLNYSYVQAQRGLNITAGATCPAGYFSAYNLSFYDELNPSNPIHVNVTGVFTIWLNDSSVNYTLVVGDRSVNFSSLCFPDNYTNYYANVMGEFSGENSELRQFYYYSAVISNNTPIYSLFGITDADSSGITLHVTDEQGVAHENWVVNIERFWPDTGDTETVAMAESDVNGEDYVYLQLYDAWYIFTIYDDSLNLMYETDRMKVSSTDLYFTIAPDVLSSIIEGLEDARDNSVLSFVELTKSFKVSYDYGTGSVTEICLWVQRRRSNLDLTSCHKCQTTSPGEITCAINPNQTGIYTAVAYVKKNPRELIGSTYKDYTSSGLYEVLGGSSSSNEGLFLGFLLVLGLLFIGLFYGAYVTILLTGLGVIFAAILNLLEITYPMIILIVVIGGFLIWKMRQ